MSALGVFIPVTFLVVSMARGRLGEVGGADDGVEGSDDGSKEAPGVSGIVEA